MQLIAAGHDFEWALQLYRPDFPLSSQGAKDYAAKVAADRAYAYQHGDTAKAHYSFAKADGAALADFGAAVASWGEEQALESFIYIEHRSDAQCLFVAVSGGVVRSDAVLSVDEVHHAMDLFSGIDHYFISASDSEPANLFKLEVGFQSIDPLSIELSPSVYSLKPLTEVLVSKVPAWFTAGLAVLVLFVGWFAVSVFSPSVDDVQINPFESYHQFVGGDSINVLNRLNQDYNTQIKLLALRGWELKGVTYTRHGTSYDLAPRSDGLTRLSGDLDTLYRFADLHGLTVMLEPNRPDGSAILMQQAANIASSEDLRLYKVEDMHSFIRDAVELYIPDSTVEFVRDLPQPGRAWKVRELVISFSAHDHRYLNTLGAIVEGLPVTFGAERGDLQLGRLVVADGLLSGTIKISLLGE